MVRWEVCSLRNPDFARVVLKRCFSFLAAAADSHPGALDRSASPAAPRRITLSEARSGLDQRLFVCPNTHISAFFKIRFYKKIIFSQTDFEKNRPTGEMRLI